MNIDRAEILRSAQSKLGSPYKLGAKWKLVDANPDGPIDCSGFVRWCYAQGGLLLPEGSTDQYAHSSMIPLSEAQPTDIGFFRDPADNSVMHHVGMLFDDTKVIEARGKLIDFTGKDVGEQVIFRPRAKWEAWKDFTGWMRPYVVLNKEAK